MKILLYGWNGWIGSQLHILLKEKHEVILGQARLEDYANLTQELGSVKPTHVLNTAGLTGRPNVDWCEDHKIEVMQINVLGAAILADLCNRSNIHYTYMGTGCIYSYDEKHPEPKLVNGKWEDVQGFTVEDPPNFDGSYYSYTKGITEKILKEFPNTCILRLRMPISDDLHSRSFVTKITKYAKVVNIPNSMSILTDLLPLVSQMMSEKLTGIYNFTNPGVISHNQILELYKKYIDPDFKWVNFTVEEQALVIKAPRSNNKLETNLPYQVPEIVESMEQVFIRMKANLDK